MIPITARRLLLLLTALVLLSGFPGQTPALAQSGHTQVTVTTITIPTHPVENALTQQTNPTFNMPYYRLDRGRYDSGRIEDREFTLIVLENDYLRLSLLPELGGRIYQAVFKPTGHNIFYQNPVLKPSPWGPPEMGWWLAAGGMEWGLPVEEHGYEWGLPWEYEIIELADGVRVELWDTTATDRLRTRVAVTLRDNASFIEISPTVENPTAAAMNYKFWLNAMLAPGPDNRVSPRLRIIMPTDTVTVHSTGDSRLPGQWQRAGWPIHNGVDWSLLGNWRQWYGFFQYPRAAGNFQAIYDEGYDEGMVRTYDSNQVQGAKFFAFGHGSTALSPDLYTDDTSSYVEIHGGVAPTFADTRRLSAGESFTWTERWYPLAGLGSLTWANAEVALHLADDGDATQLSLATTRLTTAGRILLLNRTSGAVLFEVDGQTISPEQPYQSPRLTLPNLSRDQMAVLVYDGSALLGVYQFDGPPPVTPTPGPSPTPTTALMWQGQLVRTTPFNSWASILRIWVRNQIGLPVTLSTENGNWQVSGLVGSKAEYGVDALEFAPLAPGNYVIRPKGLNADFRLALPPGVIAEVVFEQRPASSPTATPIVIPTFTPTPTASSTATSLPPTASNTPTPIPPTTTPSATPQPPTLTPTPPTPLPTPAATWRGYVRREVPFTGWASIARIWVLDYPATRVVLSAVNWNWQASNNTGTKLEYGPNALEFAPLAPGRYLVRVPAINTELTLDLQPGRITEIVFDRTTPSTPPTATATPGPQATATATVTPSPTPTATPITTWRVRLESNRVVSSNWFGVIRVSVAGKKYSLAHAAMLDGDRPVWRTSCLTGSKPEFGPYFCEFSPLIPGRFLITADGVDASLTVEVGRGGVAVVLFEP